MNHLLLLSYQTLGQKVNWILIQYQKDDPATACHQARDRESSYTSSVSNKTQKVKHPARYLLLHFINMGYTNIRRIHK